MCSRRGDRFANWGAGHNSDRMGSGVVGLRRSRVKYPFAGMVDMTTINRLLALASTGQLGAITREQAHAVSPMSRFEAESRAASSGSYGMSLPVIDRGTVDDIAVTRPARTLVDLARHESPEQLTVALDSAPGAADHRGLVASADRWAPSPGHARRPDPGRSDRRIGVATRRPQLARTEVSRTARTVAAAASYDASCTRSSR
jgi:hypothetical protein